MPCDTYRISSIDGAEGRHYMTTANVSQLKLYKNCKETESEEEVTEGSTEEEAIEREEQSEVRGTGSEKGRVKKPRYLDDYETGLD
ncbi:hypothetical protein ILUMI_17451 [Ignelater luminosus]|uniref:Uncharacterized protein n=1 Tax=Ignelater luminosus TaxID=2038154 RepID=A0A8K0CP14_IGNLU|nr:hypothetical protein ILUMI_17451 [Ignelater luminosus]